ncbi:MAG TPA: flavohemoglobin expression-modulating QEGLA motif protein [Bacteroidales bacterium]|nr:flavohemoglobin expression-modulating QEGLA motif protein [Bacteroidales bacterium]
MLKLNTSEMIRRIQAGSLFEAMHSDGAFTVKIREYLPALCTAIHNGHQLREELHPSIVLNDYERWQEEDPHTGSFISSWPVSIIVHDSRYEYDLNRNEKECIYDIAWAKKVWRSPLNSIDTRNTLTKHCNFYKVLNALVKKTEMLFGGCLVFDIHSYNYKRYDREVPLFNVGTRYIDRNKYKPVVNKWIQALSDIKLRDFETSIAENDVFGGAGNMLKQLTGEHPRTLVLATEIKKIYCNETTGEIFPEVINELREEIKKALLLTSYIFARTFTNLNPPDKSSFLPADPGKLLYKIDKELYSLVRSFELLNYVNPLNLEQERKKFFSSRLKYVPSFKYRQLSIDPFELKRKLYSIQVERIEDVSIQNMYKDTISAYANKIDILSNLGSHKFLYNSLRYYGEPREADLKDAGFLIHCPEIESHSDKLLDVDDARRFFEKEIREYGFSFRTEISSKIASKALVINHRRTAILKRGATFSKTDLLGLVNHEIGLHAVSTMNSLEQPIKLFNIGLPLNDLTQEGLAILSEYLSGNLSLKRLKVLSYRVVAIQLMLKGYDFRSLFEYLTDEYKIDAESAFYITARTFRGGGFTKDYLYLQGFKKVLKLYKQNQNLENLLIGKTSLEYLSTINEMIDRGFLKSPRYKTHAFISPKESDPILDYILKALG